MRLGGMNRDGNTIFCLTGETGIKNAFYELYSRDRVKFLSSNVVTDIGAYPAGIGAFFYNKAVFPVKTQVVNTILPCICPPSIISWAVAASASGNCSAT